LFVEKMSHVAIVKLPQRLLELYTEAILQLSRLPGQHMDAFSLKAVKMACDALATNGRCYTL